MKNISEIDTNLKVKTSIQKDDIKFYNSRELPFIIYGLLWENGKFRRMPEDIAKAVSENVVFLHKNTSGGRIRFKTDSSYVAISAIMESIGKGPHFALAGVGGFDLYEGNTYVRTFIPPLDMETGYESIIEFEDKKLRDITINFPLYSDVKELYIGLADNAIITEPSNYKNKKPVVYYGSSITQGGCASRPGMSYQNIISRRFNIDYINLGFSGSALAEDAMIEYIANLDMSVFVYDYDYNAPDTKHLQNTHEKMFKAVRKQNPDIPIIIMSRPKFVLTEEEEERRLIIEATYKNAVSSGDKNVYFIDGKMLMALCHGEGTVDNVHPTDFGFASIAKTVGDVIEENNCI